jgi:MATE family multidrug resistance protein
MTPLRPRNDDTWMGEARILAHTSLAVALAIFAHAAIATLETLFVARLGTDALAGMTLGLSLYTLAYLFSLGIVTAITPIAATAHGRRDVETLRLSAQQGVLAGLTFAVPGTLLLLLVGLVLWLMPRENR